METFKSRVYNEIKKLERENTGEKVLIVAHSGTYRAIDSSIKNITNLKEIFSAKSIKNAEFVSL